METFEHLSCGIFYPVAIQRKRCVCEGESAKLDSFMECACDSNCGYFQVLEIFLAYGIRLMHGSRVQHIGSIL